MDENVLLIILRLKENAYIVTIKNSLDDYLGKNVSLGTIYLSLKRLTREGYLRTEIGMSVSKKGGRAKKYYRLTKEGISILNEMQRLQRLLWKDFDELVEGMLEKL
jgi:DNA-binding PadR family transcriptional regulator